MKAMNLFANRSIASQLGTLRTLLVGGFLVLGIAYLSAIVTQNSAITANAKINDFRKTALEIRTQTLQARRNEKDFQLRNDARYLTEHRDTMSALGALTTRAESLAPDEASGRLVAEVKQKLSVYGSEFEKVAKSELAMGIDENSGLRGQMRNAVHKVEESVAQLKLDPLTVSMLQMRRHEKDFIERRDPAKFLAEMNKEKLNFNELLAAAQIPAIKKAEISADMERYQTSFREFVGGSNEAVATNELMRAAVHATEPALDQLEQASKATLEAADTRLGRTLMLMNLLFAAVLVTGGAFSVLGLLAVSRSVMSPLSRLTETVGRLAKGDDEARALIEEQNELGELGGAFDRMMDERVTLQRAIQRENDQLNDSVLKLLEAVAKLARKDLTVKVPVTEDVTGPVADALNLLTTETGRVLSEVTNISADVTAASLKVKEQADTVREVASAGRIEVEHTAESLANAATAMNEIAELAQVCNVSADNAIKTTKSALKAVADTVGGINNTRDTIRETEKRIKRLGERSQEISGVVNLINTIAERTHILALNASMHAASAGEAGRGFAVVADEVQRLAENARQATAQIASLVNNIQVETLDTVNTMNSAISQVVEGSKLAEQASDQMHQTEQRTAELVSLVQKIATDSTEQAKVSRDLLQRASHIRQATEETTQKVEEASQYTNHLVEYARSLLGAVRVFKLPA